MEKLIERMDAALGVMASLGPRKLKAYLEQPGPDFEKASEAEICKIIEMLLSVDPNNTARLRFSNLLRSWDNQKTATWAKETVRNTTSRRKRIHELFQSGPDLESRIDGLLPFFHLDEPLIISEKHQEWYSPTSGVRDYYWSRYIKYLREQGEWEEESLLDMDNTTRAIVECLADPESRNSYASRGLVMGYVQSGKTANFTGVAARAADAGYRLIIILAGTWNILRNQTQRRFDKQLLGKELLKNDEAYTLRQPPDWNEFLEHGADPIELGHYTWQRLTRPDIDFGRLKANIDSLEFERREKSLPIYHPSNLHELPAKLLVVKKHSGILANLVKDLKLIHTRLTDLPTLIIDDESDQAGVNTVDPALTTAPTKERSKTNKAIVELLRLFPRGQYVGYTATPYANALIDVDDPEDLFPRDFIVSLERPAGYMGVSDFFDPLSAFDDLKKDDYSQSEIAFIRRVEAPIGSDDEDLKNALRSYVLAGGIKLYRQASDPQRYKTRNFKHHTMLVHTSPRVGEHASVADRIKDLWDQCAFNSPRGLEDLQKLWDEDYRKVSTAKGIKILPKSFTHLIRHLSEAIKRIEKGPHVYLVVNSDVKNSGADDAPDFSADPVWKIVIGGNKLSRGYTVEGLTISYYRRVAGTADTLMQMGRWFGFRPGYQDLVRVFLGVAEGKRGNADLVGLFKEVCRMEERFREDIRRYARRPGAKRITPKEVPPLIYVSGVLPPTARNKMFNAMLASKNFGGQWSMLTLSPTKPKTIGLNIEALQTLLSASKAFGNRSLGGTTLEEKRTESEAILYEVANSEILAFLRAYHWLESEYEYPGRPADNQLQIDFLEKQKHGISSWLIVAPQRKVSVGKPLDMKECGELAVKHRNRVEGRGFQVFGEPAHRAVAEFLAGLEPGNSRFAAVNVATKLLQNKHRGICLLYPVREKEIDKVTIGFELLFPKNDLPFDLNFTVRRKSENAIIITE